MAKQQKRHVQCYENSMQRHIRMHTAATFFNIDGVEKIGTTTRKQTLKTNATTKQNPTLKQSCGS